MKAEDGGVTGAPEQPRRTGDTDDDGQGPRIGLNVVPVPAPSVARAAALAEECGYTSLWLGEHLVVPPVMESVYPAGAARQPFDRSTPWLDPLLVLAHAAAVTTRVRVGVGVYLLALRHPILSAKLFTTLDHLSGGRLDFAVGVGWEKEEFTALGVDFHRRGRLTDASLVAMDTLLRDEWSQVTEGPYAFEPLAFEPKPLEGPRRSRLLVGGYSEPAWRRAARTEGWYGRLDRLDPHTNAVGGWNVTAVRAFVTHLHDLRAEGGQDGEFAVIGALSATPTREQVLELHDAGVSEIVVNPWGWVDGKHVGTATTLTRVEEFASTIGLGQGSPAPLS